MQDAYCFLCHPNKELVYLKQQNFFAMLGLGPLVEGYGLLATQSHLPSLMDIPKDSATELVAFAQLVRATLLPHYGEVVMTEHGRVAPCLPNVRNIQEMHCFHAHRLVIPWTSELAQGDLAEELYNRGLKVHEFPDFLACHMAFKGRGEYLYFERVDGSCVIAEAPPVLVRQFFRRILATRLGNPDWANWMEYPRLDLIEAAQARLMTER